MGNKKYLSSFRKFNEKSVNLKIKFAKPHKTAYMRACSLTLSESGYFLRQTLRVTTDPSDFRSILMKIPLSGFGT